MFAIELIMFASLVWIWLIDCLLHSIISFKLIDLKYSFSPNQLIRDGYLNDSILLFW